MSKVIHVNDDNFQNEVLGSEAPVLVDFWAEWCAPCRMIAPVIEQLAEEYDGKVKVVKIDTEQSFAVPAQYGIRGIPTVMLFSGGAVVDQVVGSVPKSTLTTMIDSHLAPN